MTICSIIKLPVLVLLILLSCCVDHPACALSDSLVDISPLDIVAKILSFIKSLNFDSTILDDIIVTELEIIKQVTAYEPNQSNEDIQLNVTQLLEKHGYKTEEYQVVTPDGYIMGLQRVPGNGTVVFLMHGLFGSADEFVTAGPDNALVYVLASHGYDVWLGNARGNKYSRKHETLSPKCAEFWDFSWHETGIYDLPAMIDFALNKSGHTKLTFVGYSQGNTNFFVMASMLPEYNLKISLMVALGPVAYFHNGNSIIFNTIAVQTGLHYKFLRLIGINEFDENEGLNKLTAAVWGKSTSAGILNLCSLFFILITGLDRGQLNFKDLPVTASHLPAGASIKQMAHYGQEILSAKFRMFDYGRKKNEEIYGVPSPPEYPIGSITAPVALFYSQSDLLCSHIDVSILRSQLPNVVMFHLVDKYNHVDYVWATNVREKINEPILELIRQYE